MNTKTYIALALVATLFSACGSSDSKNNDGKGEIDLRDYYPSKSMTKTFSSTERVGDKVSTRREDEIINVTNNVITTTVDTNVTERVVFSDTNITLTDLEDNEVYSIYRHVDIGDKIFSKKINSTENVTIGKITTAIEATCKLKSKESKFEKNDNVYTGDLLKIDCVTEGTVTYDINADSLDFVADDLNGSHPIYDTSSYYIAKGLGEVAEIDNNCIPINGVPLVDDRKEGEECKDIKNYNYRFYLPN